MTIKADAVIEIHAIEIGGEDRMIQVIKGRVDDKDLDSTFLERVDKNFNILLQRVLKEYPRDVSGIAAIEIETLNRCNNDCSFCPVNRNKDSREYAMMSEELFHLIIDQLTEISYAGRLSIFSNNEPLLDKRIYEFIEYAKCKLPNAYIHLCTNGLLLNPERFERLVGSLDQLIIDNYDDNYELLPNVQEIVNLYADREFVCEVIVILRKKNQILDSRGGLAPNRNMEKTFTSVCQLPFGQLIIRPDGKISRCCQDALGNTTMGDLNKHSIQEIWEGKPYNTLRDDLLGGKRETIEFCKYCDMSLQYPLGKEWQARLIHALSEILWEKVLKENRYVILYGEGKKIFRLVSILTMLGIKIDRIVNSLEEIRFQDHNQFVLFTKVDCSVLDVIDPEGQGVGKDYLSCDLLLDMIPDQFNDNVDYKKAMVVELLNTAYKKDKKIVFGTGEISHKVMQFFGWKAEDIEAFIDNDANKCGKHYLGREIKTPEYLSQLKNENFIVIIASSYYREMEEQLLNQKLCHKEHILNGYLLLTL